MTRRVLIYGDSNSFGTMPMASLGAEGIFPKDVRWGGVMARELGEDWDVIVEGLPGRTAVLDDPIEGAYRNGLTVLPAILMSHRPIDLLIICLGTNDQKHRFGLMAEDVALGLGRLAREAFASGAVAEVMLMAPPPLRMCGPLKDMFLGIDERSAGLAAQIERFAAVEGAAFFDAGRVIEVDPLDGVHWSAEAHDALGRAMAQEVRELHR